VFLKFFSIKLINKKLMKHFELSVKRLFHQKIKNLLCEENTNIKICFFLQFF